MPWPGPPRPCIAGIGGVFFALSYDLSPAMFQLGLKAFPATILGGLDAVLGSGVGGLLIGITGNLAGGYLGSGMKEVAGFVHDHRGADGPPVRHLRRTRHREGLAMRSGDFKQTYGELVALDRLTAGRLWSAVLVAGLIVAPLSAELLRAVVPDDHPDHARRARSASTS